MKSQVKLLVASRMVKYQEQQLLEMLDSVPDKVLVCNFSRDEDLKPSPLYNNRQMRQFFGVCLVNDAKKKKDRTKGNSSGRHSYEKPQVKRRSKFEQRIFQSIEIGGNE